MKIFINNVEYPLLNDYNIQESAGATSIITANIKLDDNEVPQPFDSVLIKDEELDKGGNILSTPNFKDNVEILSNVLTIAKIKITNYSQLIEAGLTWGDLT